MMMRKNAAVIVLLVLVLGGESLSCAFTVGAQEENRALSRSTRPPLVVPLGAEGFVAFKLETRGGEGATTAADARDDVPGVVPQVLADDDRIIHRVLVDAAGKFLFGYDLRIEPTPPDGGARQFKITVKPMDAAFERRLQARAGLAQTTRLATLPATSAEQIVDDGAGVAIELLANPRTGAKIVDVVRVAFERARLFKDLTPPRDFTLADAQLALRAPRLRVNDQLVADARTPRDLRGAILWFHLPGRGRFVLSLASHEGYDFRKVAVVERNRITFEWDGDRYEWTSTEPIILSEEKLYLWVLHDSRFDPEAFMPLRPPVARKDALTRGVERIEENLQTLADRSARQQSEYARRNSKEPQGATAGRNAAQGDAPIRLTSGATDRVERILPRS